MPGARLWQGRQRGPMDPGILQMTAFTLNCDPGLSSFLQAAGFQAQSGSEAGGIRAEEQRAFARELRKRNYVQTTGAQAKQTESCP